MVHRIAPARATEHSLIEPDPVYTVYMHTKFIFQHLSPTIRNFLPSYKDETLGYSIRDQCPRLPRLVAQILDYARHCRRCRHRHPTWPAPVTGTFPAAGRLFCGR